jgi:hypothetical protein
MAKLTETERSRLYTELSTATSPHAAEILMHEVLDIHWEDLATKSEFADLRSEAHVGFAKVDARFAKLDAKVDTGFAQLDAKLEQHFRVQLNRTFTLMIALFSLLGGLIIVLH